MNAPSNPMSPERAVQEALSGAHAPMSKVFPGKVATTVGTRNAYVKCGGDVAVMTVGDDAEERARAAARAIAAHDTLVAMVKDPSGLFWQQFGRARRLSDEEREAIKRRGPGPVIALLDPPEPAPVGPELFSEISFAISAAMRRRNRSLHRGDQPIVPCMELAVTDMVLNALAECGYKVIPPGQESTADSADPIKLALAEVLEECDKVRAELKATGHAFDGAPLHQLVDRAIDGERKRRITEVSVYKDRLAHVRAVAAI